MSKVVKILPEKTEGEYRVSRATSPLDGLEAIHDKSRSAFNRNVAGLIPKGQKAAIYYEPGKAPKIVHGRHLTAA